MEVRRQCVDFPSFRDCPYGVDGPCSPRETDSRQKTPHTITVPIPIDACFASTRRVNPHSVAFPSSGYCAARGQQHMASASRVAGSQAFPCGAARSDRDPRRILGGTVPPFPHADPLRLVRRHCTVKRVKAYSRHRYNNMGEGMPPFHRLASISRYAMAILMGVPLGLAPPFPPRFRVVILSRESLTVPSGERTRHA